MRPALGTVRFRSEPVGAPQPSLSCREHVPGAQPPVTEGSVIIIGGAEDKVRDRVILSRFVALAGGRDATVAVISTASSLGLEAGERYKQVLGELGVHKVRTIHAVTRAQANDETAALALRDATGIFMTGGNQLRLSSTIGGTRLADARPGAVPPGGRRRRHQRRRLGDVQPHDRVRRERGHAQAPDGPDRRRPRRAARGHRRPALPAAQPARPAAQPHRPEPVAARPRRRRGHGRRRRPGPRHGGHRARLDHRRRRRRSRRPMPGRSTATGR